MLDNYLIRENVLRLIDELKTNPKYNNKEKNEENIYSENINNELSLYILYDALFKYKLIIDDDLLFGEFIEQIEKIYKKIDNYNQIIVGVNKLICYIASKYLKIKNINDSESKKQIISYIYDKYISNGYYIHGFSTIYEDSIKNNGFISEVYINYYRDMMKVKKIFEKYKLEDIIEKDFTINKSYFTDDFIMGCYYSMMSPGYFSNTLFNRKFCGKDIDNSPYLNCDYDTSIMKLKKYMVDNFFSDEDIKYILDVFSREWEFINKVDKKISLLVVKRCLINDNFNSLDEYLNDDEDIYDIVDRILSPKNGNIVFNGVINSDDIVILSLDSFYEKKKMEDEIVINENDLPYKYNKEIINRDFLDAYGNVYIFLIFGSLFISLGVIATIIMVIRGI